MDCRTFREHHSAFIDDTLPASDVVAMECHRIECPACAAHDTRVRRGLLLVRNLAPVECSPDFSERLYSRLRTVEIDRRPVHTARGPGLGTFAALAASVLVLAGGSLAFYSLEPTPAIVALQPVVADQVAPDTDPLSSPVILASSAAGIPAWPAVLLADEMPLHVAETGFRLFAATW